MARPRNSLGPPRNSSTEMPSCFLNWRLHPNLLIVVEPLPPRLISCTTTLLTLIMDAVKQLRPVSTLLDNYWLRSQVFRTVQFSSALLAGLLERPRPLWSDKLMKLSGSISNMRVMLRLLDDIPNLSHVLSTWHTAQVIMHAAC